MCIDSKARTHRHRGWACQRGQALCNKRHWIFIKSWIPTLNIRRGQSDFHSAWTAPKCLGMCMKHGLKHRFYGPPPKTSLKGVLWASAQKLFGNNQVAKRAHKPTIEYEDSLPRNHHEQSPPIGYFLQLPLNIQQIISQLWPSSF